MDQTELMALADRILNKEASDSEVALYIYWFDHFQSDTDYQIEDERLTEAALLARIDCQIAARRTRRVKKVLYSVAAAAAVLIFFAAGMYYLAIRNTADHSNTELISANDIQPGSNRAVLTLANGQQILLDSSGDSIIAQQPGVSIDQSDSGLLAYHAIHSNMQQKMQYNTLVTPKGGQYRLILPDGTRVWLNAASSIKFPTAFIGDTRAVNITGEVYFEVAHNARHPFVVSAGAAEVRVLGTHFDINAYGDNGLIKTTLLEGSVEVSSGKHHTKIKPGQQAIIGDRDADIKVNQVNVDGIVAWTHGFLSLEDNSVRQFMTELSRWYDVDVVYQGNIPDKKLGGLINRNTSLSDVLNVLAFNGIKTKLEGHTIIVGPAN